MPNKEPMTLLIPPTSQDSASGPAIQAGQRPDVASENDQHLHLPILHPSRPHHFPQVSAYGQGCTGQFPCGKQTISYQVLTLPYSSRLFLQLLLLIVEEVLAWPWPSPESRSCLFREFHSLLTCFFKTSSFLYSKIYSSSLKLKKIRSAPILHYIHPLSEAFNFLHLFTHKQCCPERRHILITLHMLGLVFDVSWSRIVGLQAMQIFKLHDNCCCFLKRLDQLTLLPGKNGRVH